MRVTDEAGKIAEPVFRGAFRFGPSNASVYGALPLQEQPPKACVRQGNDDERREDDLWRNCHASHARLPSYLPSSLTTVFPITCNLKSRRKLGFRFVRTRACRTSSLPIGSLKVVAPSRAKAAAHAVELGKFVCVALH
jgi:hypothetical protein